MRKLSTSLVCTVALLGAYAVPAAAQHGHQDKQVPATVSFGVGLNTASPNNTPNHRMLPQDIRIEVGSVVNFMVAGFHQIFVYKPGVTIDQIVPPGSGTFVNQDLDLLYYQGLTQAEAAEVLGVSERTVKRRWQAARLALHDALGGEIPE